MAIQGWKKLCSLVKNQNRSFRFTPKLYKREAAAAIRPTNQEKLRLAVLISKAALQFRKGIDGLDLDSQGKEQTERTEEAINVGSRYYCHQCDQVVSATGVDVNMACPLCRGCFMEECGDVSSLHVAMLSESQPSASDTDGNGAMVIPPSNQTVLDIVDNNNGSALKPFKDYFGLWAKTLPAPGVCRHSCRSHGNQDYEKDNRTIFSLLAIEKRLKGYIQGL